MATRTARRPGGRLLLHLALALACVTAPACSRSDRHGRPQALVIGVDGGTWKLLKPWIDRGDLPHLKALMDGGVSGNLTSVVPNLSPPAWTSAITGVNPGKHGVFDFLRRLPHEMTTVNVTARSRRVDPIWTLLSQAGFKVGVVNVPATDPPDPVNGFMISGMPHLGITGYAHPPELEKELVDYRLDKMDTSIEKGREQELLDDIVQTEARRFANIEMLLKTRDWDFAWVVFTASDRVQHFFWRFMDPQSPGYDAADAARFGSAVHDVWVALDGYVGRLVTEARARKGADLPVVVLSDHGFGPIHREFRMQSFLRNPPPGRAPINTAYSYETNGSLLYFSVAGREPEGVLSPEEFEAERTEAINRLKTAHDPVTGLAPALAIYRRDEIFRGRYSEIGPDLMLVPSPRVYISNDKGHREPWGDPSYTFSAHHEMDGIVIANGGPFRKGHLDSGATLLDITPTLLYLLGQPVPGYSDGRALTQIFQPEYVRSHPVVVDKRELPGGPATADLDSVLNGTMKGLGYIN